MKVVQHDIGFNLSQVLEEELPILSSYYDNRDDLRKDVEDLFDFPIKHSPKMPFYTVKESSCDRIYDTFTNTYAMMVSALDELFRQDNETIYKFFGEEFLRKHPYFIDYARHAFNRKHEAIYGRFDAVVDPVSEEVTGIYELNGDTPVMLFESVNLQNYLTQTVTGSGEAQFNNYYGELSAFAEAKWRLADKVAIVFDANYVDDAATCETMAQAIGESATILLGGVNDIDFEHAELHSPWYLRDDQLKSMFILCPWEEMVEAFPTGFIHWNKWADNVQFFEPAWRWFLSNKGIWAWITHLMETDTEFAFSWDHLPVLKTYVDPDEAKKRLGSRYVTKPPTGRLSNNIKIWKDGQLEYESDGSYDGCPVVYQEYHAPSVVNGTSSFIGCAWMSPMKPRSLEMQASTLAFREFDERVLSITNERFIPHLVELEQ